MYAKPGFVVWWDQTYGKSMMFAVGLAMPNI